MQKRVFLIHGWDGSPDSCWFPWLKNELEQRGFAVEVPAMPNPEAPKIEEWIQYLSQLAGDADENTYFVGHSMGCRAILGFLQGIDEAKRIGGAVLVAGWISLSPYAFESEEDKLVAQPWLQMPIDWDRVKKVGNKFVAIFSDDDPFVALEENKATYEEKLGAKIIVEHNKGHFSDDAGVKELPSALAALLEIA
ncbi:MAG: serine hydrolase family protein [Candidatus Wildermuthbacteria bacterium]|nr:serine hydrolase family protein [Candidatus Wildermuthbacteria bacterium]